MCHNRCSNFQCQIAGQLTKVSLWTDITICIHFSSYAPAPNRRRHWDDAVWRLSSLYDVCLSVAYIGPKSRTERPRKTKIGTEVAHITRDLDTTFKVKRSRSPGRFTHCSVNASSSCSSDRGNVLSVGTYCYIVICRPGRLGCVRRFGAHREMRGAGAYCGGSRTACY